MSEGDRVVPSCGLALLLSGLALVGCARPEGVALDRPADGRFDSFEQYALLQMALHEGRPGQDSETLMTLWNDFRVARRGWLLSQGFDPRQEGLHLRLFATAEESIARHEELYGHDSPHFFARSSRTIYTFSDVLPETWAMLLHEAGHDLGHPEFFAEANRLHGLIFTLCLDPAVGAAVVVPKANGLRSPLLTRWMPYFGTRVDELDTYSRSVLVFLRRAAEAPGSFDQALRDIVAADPAELEADPALAEGQSDARSAWIALFMRLFESPSFLGELSALLRQRGQPDAQAEQLQLYLRVAAHDLELERERTSASAAPIALLNTLLDHMAQHGTFYPDMRFRLAEALGDHYAEATEDATPLVDRDAWSRVLLALEMLPCSFDPWACPDQAASLRRRQLQAYRKVVAAHVALGAPADALVVIADFLGRFYPTEDLSRTDTLSTLFILLRAGIASALTLGDPCGALAHAERYDRVACYHQHAPATCASDYPYDWDAEEALRQAELQALRAQCPSTPR